MSNKVIFVKGQGGLGTPLPGTDYISGLLFYSDATLPSGFTASDRIKVVYSLDEAVALGITNASLGATQSTATDLCTTKFTAGDTYKLTCAIIDSTNPIAAIATAGTVTLCDFTAITADAANILASVTRIAAEINLGAAVHGFTASASVATVTITAPANQGIFLNSGTPYVKTVVGAYASTLTQNVVTGIASDIDILHYHISEFFRIQPQGKLYVGVYATADVGTFASVTLMQNYALGEIKQLGIYEKSTAFSTAHCTTIQALVTSLEAAYKPLVVLYGAEISGTANVTSLTNLRALSANEVSVVVGQDGAAKGFKLWKATGKSINCVGTTLGCVALSKVSDCIAWVGQFNMSDTEFDMLAYANGQAYTAVTDSARDNVDLYGYIFLKKQIGITGSFFNDSHSCISLTSDYAFIERNRTILKCIANTRAFLLPQLASPLKVNANGTLTADTVAYFETLCSRALEQIQRDEEISAFEVIINPAQNVLTNSSLTITIKIVPVGVARTITVGIGFALSVS